MATATATTAPQIERRHLSYKEFVREHLYPHKPVILTGAIDSWRAKSIWTPEWFKANHGSMKLTIDGKEYLMADFIDRVLSSSDANPAPYLRNAIMERFLPELLQDIQPLPEYFSPNWLDGPFSKILHSRLHRGSAELYIGGKGGKFPILHFDSAHTHAFICQIYGTKQFTAYSPEQAPYLYLLPGQYNASQIKDIENVDLNKFPLFAKAVPMQFLLEPGEVLFIPGGLWHTAKMLTPSISVSVNRANASNWSSLTSDMCAKAPMPLKPFAAAYLTGMRVLRTIYGS